MLSPERYTNLTTLDVAGNKLTTLDVSPFSRLAQLYAGSNALTEVKFENNRNLWLFYAAGNQLSSIDFTGAPNIDQLDLGHNLFESIDLTPLKQLRTLSLVVNSFTFATLPAAFNADGSSVYAVYNYGSQRPVAAACVDGKVDLSAQAKVGDHATTFRWFVGVPEFDSDGNMNGEELVAGDEYTVEDGVTTFNLTYDGVMCVMTNPAFPNLYLYTDLMNVTSSGIEDIMADENAEAVYYNLQGIRVANPERGTIYIVRKGNTTSKVLYR